MGPTGSLSESLGTYSRRKSRLGLTSRRSRRLTARLNASVRPQQDMPADPQALIEDFRKVAQIAGVSVPPSALLVERLPAPHKAPSSLPRGKMAVYVFEWKNQCLKVGKVGPNSQARYTSKHYGPSSSNSNLAQSVLAGSDELGISNVSDSTV